MKDKIKYKAKGIYALKIGESISFSKTISETDIYLFAGITGDFSPNHINKEYMKLNKYTQRIAHGALIVGFMSTASALMGIRQRERCKNTVLVNYGYDRIRFIKPVFIGDTITVTHTIKSIDPEESKIYSEDKVKNQREELVAAAINIIKVL